MGLGNALGFCDEAPESAGGSNNIGRILDVTTTGNDSTAVIGNPGKPFRTVKEAMSKSVSGDLIRAHTGLYDEYNIPPKSNVTLYMLPGAIMQPTFNNGKVPIFTDLVLGVGVPNFKVRGNGEFNNVGIFGNDTSAFVASFSTSKYDIEASRVSSFEAWNQAGATIKLKNALIDFELASYLGGIVILENCVIKNAQFHMFYRPDNSKLICRNCIFIKDASNVSWTSNYPNKPEKLECYIYDGTFFNAANDSVIEFHNTNFINTLGADNILVGNQNNANSYMGFYGCKFYNTNAAKKAILYDDTGRTDTNTLKFFFSDCQSNVNVAAIDSNNNGSQITNQFVPLPPLFVNANFKLYY